MNASDPLSSGLRRVLEFVNTEEIGRSADALATCGEAAAWLAGAGLPSGLSGQRDLDRLHALRSGIRKVLESHEAGLSSADGWVLVSEAAEGVCLRLDVRSEVDEVILRACEGGIEETIGALMAIVYDAVRDGTWVRLKACRAETCRWAFFDASKNASGAWCSMAVCGNRAKARRRRQKVATGSAAH